MSDIDQYSHTCLGLIECPAPSGLIFHAIYHLEEDIPESQGSFQGRSGDIILGGGMGEHGAMLISNPEAFFIYTDFEVISEDMELYKKASFKAEEHKPIFRAYWTPTQSYSFGVGYVKRGWGLDKGALDYWLVHHVLGFLIKQHRSRCKFPDTFRIREGSLKPFQDGSICRLLTHEEDKMYNWRKYKNDE